MRIKSIELSWFRGAADPVLLEPDCKSMVVYGENGSGKSSFVDAIEYVLNGGRISHLAHEYSGKHQEKAVPNTHKPTDRKTELRIAFKDGAELRIEIMPSGSSATSGADSADMKNWDYRRTILRQDEVAAFIHNTKGGKYSALLPLLGLHPMELAAENLRQLARAVEQQSKLKELKATLREVENKRKATFGADTDEQIDKEIEDLHSKYCGEKLETEEALSRCAKVAAALDARINEFSADQRRYLGLQSIAELKIKQHSEQVRTASQKLVDSVEPLIAEKLQVLQSARSFANKLSDEKEVNCPACGQSIPVDLFQAHVQAERRRLQEIIETFDTRKAAIATLCDTVRSLKLNVGKAELKAWRDELAKGGFSEKFAYIDQLNTEELRTSCSKEHLDDIESKLLPLIAAAAASSKDAPADVKQLSTDKQNVEVSRDVIAAREQVTAVAQAESLVLFLNSLEQGVRDEIKLRSQNVIDEISADIQSMWATLHPDKSVEDVRLYLPKDDKAIDIGLKFHGVAQDSPRLTLSEGNRNSLGLCIFLAMAKREADKDRPLFLDDVTVSLDRNHRGMILDLLEKEFTGRQVIILTHDRDWYTELRQQLDAKNWIFKALLPYETPDVGIRWSHKTTTFDDARAHLKDRPDSAGNDARKIMDVELALIAERLKISLPFVRADKNDKRMAHEFLERFVADGKKCLEKKMATGYSVHSDAIDAFDKADRLLTSWANRASHTFDLVAPEAEKLIDASEKAIEMFKCPSCGKGVWFADAAGSKWLQCQCAEIRWRYGKL